jgi:hypothetical protein
VSLPEHAEIFWRRFVDTMDKWDQAKLAEVVVSKSGNAQTSTE